MFHYVESIHFCWTKHFNFLLNNCNNLISLKLFGKLFHIIAPPVANPGEGPRGPAPLIFRRKWAPKGGKKIFEAGSPPLSQGLDDRPPPHYLQVWICHRPLYLTEKRHRYSGWFQALKMPGGGGTLEISRWGCAARSLKPLTFTRASSAEFCHPILE